MDPRPERQMRVRLAGEVELVGPLEHRGVAVRRAEQQTELRAARDLHAVDLEGFEHPPFEHLQRRVEPQELLDRVRQQRAVGAELAEAVGVAEQRPPAEQRRVDRRLVPRVQQQHARADELVLGEPFALVQHERQLRDQVLARVLLALPRELSQVGRELVARADRVLLHLGRRVQLVHLADVRGPRTQVVAVGLRDPEHLGDHGDRERFGDPEQVELARTVDLVDEAVHDRLHARPKPLDEPRGERLRHEPPHPGVVRGLHVQDPGVDQVPERGVPLGRRGAAHLGVRGEVSVRAPEPSIAQQGVDVLVPRDQPVVGGVVVGDRFTLAQVGVDRVRVGDEPELGRGEVHRSRL